MLISESLATNKNLRAGNIFLESVDCIVSNLLFSFRSGRKHANYRYDILTVEGIAYAAPT